MSFDSSLKLCLVVLLSALIRYLTLSTTTTSTSTSTAFPTPSTAPNNPLLISFLTTASTHPITTRIHRVATTTPHTLTGKRYADLIVKEVSHLAEDSSTDTTTPHTIVTCAFEPSEITSLQSFIQKPLPKLIFIDQGTFDRVQSLASAHLDDTRFVITTILELSKFFGKSLADIESIRVNPSYLEYSSGGSQPSFASIVLRHVRPYLLREASRLNPFDTSTFLWVTLSDPCIGSLAPESSTFLHRITSRFLVPYTTQSSDTTHVHSFRQPSFNFYVFENRAKKQSNILLVNTQSVWGGNSNYIELVVYLYDVFLRFTVLEGLLGDDSTILTIVATRYPTLFQKVNDENACVNSVNEDFSCEEGSSPSAVTCAVLTLAKMASH